MLSRFPEAGSSERPLATNQLLSNDDERGLRERALFDLAVDSKLRGNNMVQARIDDLIDGGRVRTRAIVVQQKTGRPVQFNLLDAARTSSLACSEQRGGWLDTYASPGRLNRTNPLNTRLYDRLVNEGARPHRSGCP